MTPYSRASKGLPKPSLTFEVVNQHAYGRFDKGLPKPSLTVEVANQRAYLPYLTIRASTPTSEPVPLAATNLQPSLGRAGGISHSYQAESVKKVKQIDNLGMVLPGPKRIAIELGDMFLCPTHWRIQSRFWVISNISILHALKLVGGRTDSPNPTMSWDSNPNPEDVPFWLPSAIPSNRRHRACTDNLPDPKATLRVAQCNDASDGLRHTLRIKTFMISSKIRMYEVKARASDLDRSSIAFIKERWKRNLEKKTLRPRLDADVCSYADPQKKVRKGRKGIWEDGVIPPLNQDDDDAGQDKDSNEDDEMMYNAPRDRCEGTGETRRALSWIWMNTAIIVNDGTNGTGEQSDERENEILVRSGRAQ
ncbi:hypothetical protein CPB83DRAFT_894795 [Crepidotus variabilis]|uniref:Uncharacterized protein n=1 Tax=Crepidotus variabilis TaxID=179855 RepID=A0A9P6EE73_9AGAR|nr:hypothetical protein CPB83DRAFT_894795 [Crepidotus variabilis]